VEIYLLPRRHRLRAVAVHVHEKSTCDYGAEVVKNLEPQGGLILHSVDSWAGNRCALNARLGFLHKACEQVYVEANLRPLIIDPVNPPLRQHRRTCFDPQTFVRRTCTRSVLLLHVTISSSRYDHSDILYRSKLVTMAGLRGGCQYNGGRLPR